ncbi:MAG: hypothetical protein R3C97_02660 [Geminicoccaceae bacterium]
MEIRDLRFLFARCRSCSIVPLCAVLLALLAQPSLGREPPPSPDREFVLATVSPSVSGAEARLFPVIAATNAALARYGMSVRLHVFGTYTSLVWQMWDEKIDLVIDDTFMALNIMRDTGSQPLGALTRPGGD